ncbi:MAG: hypothetical protein ACRENP_11780 [Longimicrobiales bacterium]
MHIGGAPHIQHHVARERQRMLDALIGGRELQQDLELILRGCRLQQHGREKQ